MGRGHESSESAIRKARPSCPISEYLSNLAWQCFSLYMMEQKYFKAFLDKLSVIDHWRWVELTGDMTTILGIFPHLYSARDGAACCKHHVFCSVSCRSRRGLAISTNSESRSMVQNTSGHLWRRCHRAVTDHILHEALSTSCMKH